MCHVRVALDAEFLSTARLGTALHACSLVQKLFLQEKTI